MGLMANLAVNDRDARRQRMTFLNPPPVAVAALATAMALSGTRLGGLLGFICVIFASVASQRFGARGRALGTMAFNAYFFTLFAHATLRDLAPLACGAILGLGVAFVVRFVAIPERPEAIARLAST